MIDDEGLNVLIHLYGSGNVVPTLLSKQEQIELELLMKPWISVCGTAEWYETKRRIVIEILNREGRP